MEIGITNLRAEKAKTGEIMIFFNDSRLSPYRILVYVNRGQPVKWVSEDGIERTAIG